MSEEPIDNAINNAMGNSQEALLNLLQMAPPGRSKQRRRWRWIGGGLALSLMISLFFFYVQNKGSEGQYLVEETVTGTLMVTVSATGTLNPIITVDVGSEESGTLAEVLVQENDLVKKGQVLARLDTEKLKDAVSSARAALAVAEASLVEAAATVAETKASFARMNQVSELTQGKEPAKTDLETADATLKRAIAAEAGARAAILQAQATLKTAETNLYKGEIRSPVDGVVLTRNVETGQTVVASMTSPVLFVLAEDLTKMELDLNVDEADVSAVKIGQPSTFTVSAWSGRIFPATIQRVGFGPTLTNNVVTYKTVLTVANDDLALRPGMTATASIITANRENVLLVPNAALRFTPPDQKDKKQQGGEGGFLAKFLPRPPATPPKKRGVSALSDNQHIWVLESGVPRAVSIKKGVSNGRQTEVTESDLKAGMSVITDYMDAKK